MWVTKTQDVFYWTKYKCTKSDHAENAVNKSHNQNSPEIKCGTTDIYTLNNHHIVDVVEVAEWH